VKRNHEAFITVLLFVRNSTLLSVLFCSAIVLKVLSKQVQYPSLIFYSLTYEQAFLNSNPKDLVLFLNEKRFNQYLNTEKILWQVRSWNFQRVKSKDFTYDASFYLFIRCISWKAIFSLFREVSRFWKLPNKLSYRTFSEFYTQYFENFVWSSVYLELPSGIQLVTTQSTYAHMPISFSEKYAAQTFRIMMWYSINSQGISRDFNSPEGIPLLRITDKIDLQLVWTRTQANLLENKNVGKIAIVGSCLFQAKQKIHTVKKSANKLNVLFFDVNPLRQDLTFKSIKKLNSQESLYDYNFCSRILLNSIYTLDRFTQSYGMSFQITLKPKRKKLQSHLNYNKNYEELLLDLEKQDSRFSVSLPNLNLYTAIGNADLVLGPPYTSPVFVARELNVPSCYLAFGSTGWRIHKSLDSIPVHFSEEEFLEFLEDTFLSK
jgi:polysaccharide biosynthesis PFTS motif protein